MARVNGVGDEIAGAEVVAVEGIQWASVDQHELRVRLRDGSVDALAVSFGARERAELERVADDVDEAVSPAEREAVVSTATSDLVLHCGSCGAPAAPADVDVVECRFCGAAIHVTALIRQRVVAAAEVTEDRRYADALVRRLLEQPSGRRQTAMQLGVLALGIATAVVWARLGTVFGLTAVIATFIAFAAERCAIAKPSSSFARAASSLRAAKGHRPRVSNAARRSRRIRAASTWTSSSCALPAIR